MNDGSYFGWVGRRAEVATANSTWIGVLTEAYSDCIILDSVVWIPTSKIEFIRVEVENDQG